MFISVAGVGPDLLGGVGLDPQNISKPGCLRSEHNRKPAQPMGADPCLRARILRVWARVSFLSSSTHVQLLCSAPRAKRSAEVRGVVAICVDVLEALRFLATGAESWQELGDGWTTK